MENSEKYLRVNAIKNGTVLDHIPSEQIYRVIDILGIADSTNPVTFGINLESRSMGKKGIIKLAERFFKDDELNKIALVAPMASVNIIRDFEVIEKKVLTIPESITGIAKCFNPMCVTNHQEIETKFKTIVKDNEIKLLCTYCEKTTDSKHIKIISNSH
jgi:aspartate carbamoyltransferase regulatory subunit